MPLFRTSSLIFSQIVMSETGLAVVKSGNEIEIVVISFQSVVHESVPFSFQEKVVVSIVVVLFVGGFLVVGPSDGTMGVPELSGVVAGASDGKPDVPELFGVESVAGASEGTVGVSSTTIVVLVMIGVVVVGVIVVVALTLVVVVDRVVPDPKILLIFHHWAFAETSKVVAFYYV